ncbi:PIN domain-containing protein [Halobellus marinus]|uniref:PIN domain-containing protein n=1 Tax=Halobellus TaxID=1073986 RepID=UPI0028AB86A8|nr:PIN domain-containing protein [Halobellus sp. DFY28]
MYAETDFLLALIKDEDWLGTAAETLYSEHDQDLWTSQFTLIELLLVAYREELDTERVVTNAANLVEVRGDEKTVVAASTYVEDHGFTPFDALHLVESDGDTIVSSDDAYEGFVPRLDLKEVDEE